jgi:hypothetical protein
MIFATILFAVFPSAPDFISETKDGRIWYLPIFLWFAGVATVWAWFSRVERILRKKISMVFLIIGQILLWWSFYIIYFSKVRTEYPYWLIPAIIVLWTIAGIFAKSKHIGRYKGVERRNFSYATTREILKKQQNCCGLCKMNLTSQIIQYDHIDGDRSNNDIDNCMALCSNCHSKKTRTI